MLKQMEKLIAGQILRTEFIWNALTRNLHFRGSSFAAISGIDIALWDLKAKFLASLL